MPLGDDAGQWRRPLRRRAARSAQAAAAPRRTSTWRATLNDDSVLSNAFCEMNSVVQQAHVHRPRLFGERQLCARALDGPQPVDQARLQVRRIDPPDLLPGANRLALADGELGEIARDLGLDDRLANRLQRPGYGSQRASGVLSTYARSAVANCSGVGLAACGAPASERFDARSATAPARPPASVRTTSPPMIRRRVMRIVIDFPSRPCRSRSTRKVGHARSAPTPAQAPRPVWMR